MESKVKGCMRLTLSEAVATGRLRDFVAQETRRGVGSADTNVFDQTVRRVVTEPKSEGQTSRSPSDDGSSDR